MNDLYYDTAPYSVSLRDPEPQCADPTCDRPPYRDGLCKMHAELADYQDESRRLHRGHDCHRRGFGSDEGTARGKTWPSGLAGREPVDQSQVTRPTLGVDLTEPTSQEGYRQTAQAESNGCQGLPIRRPALSAAPPGDSRSPGAAPDWYHGEFDPLTGLAR